MEKINIIKNKKQRSSITLLIQLLTLVKPLIFYMFLAVSAGILGFMVSIFIPVLGTYALLKIVGFDFPVSQTLLITLCIVFAFSRGFLRYAEQLCNHFIAFKVLALLRDKIFAALRKLAPAKLETKEKGTLISMITSDVEIMEVFYAHTISPIVIGMSVSVLMSIFIAIFHWQLGLIALSTYVFVGILIPSIISRIGKNAGVKQRKNYSDLHDYLFDTLRGMREVFQFGIQNERLENISNLSDELRKDQRTLKKYTLITNFFNGFALVFFPALMIIIGGNLYQSGTISFPQMLIPVIALLSSYGPVLALSNVANSLLLTFASGNRIMDLIEENPVVKDVTGSKNITFSGLECENVSFSYSEEEILKDLNLKIEKNKILAITGKSGAGKSTLLKLMMRFWETKAGKIMVSNEDINTINTQSLRQNQSYLTQDPIMFNETIAENIRIGKIDATQKDIEAAAKKASIHDFIISLDKGYETVSGELGDRLSSGEKQRINLARLFLHDAPLILLDEPTSNVDSLNEGIILKSLKESSANKTVVLVSHRESTKGIADLQINIEADRFS